VGVYGMSTTLTKEGVQLLKDAVSGSKESLRGDVVGVSSVGSGVDRSDGAPASVSSEGAAVGAKDSVCVNDNVRSSGGRWMSSWFGWRTNNDKSGKAGVKENDN